MRKYKNILITGADGFIGLNFVKHMLANKKEFGFDKLVAIDNLSMGSTGELWKIEDEKLDSYILDINHTEIEHIMFEQHDIDCVVHFAAESHVDRSIEDPLAFIRTNVLGTANLLNAAKNYWQDKPNTLFHHISTDEVFGEATDHPFVETDIYNPRSPYSASKASSDHLVRSFHETYGLNITISNCGNNYGPYQNNEKLIPKIIENALCGKSIPVYGDGKQKRNWLYVEDHCIAITTIIFNAKIGETFLIGSENTTENLYIITSILNKLNSSEDLIEFVEDRLGHDVIYDICSDKIQKDLHWYPQTRLDDGLARTIKHYKNKLRK
tara:strand:- start:610 stop:1584 length:975 start_codon:yes stop_codon:yes gene_type:complete